VKAPEQKKRKKNSNAQKVSSLIPASVSSFECVSFSCLMMNCELD